MSKVQRSSTFWLALLVTTSTIFCSCPDSIQSAVLVKRQQSGRVCRIKANSMR